MSIKDSLNKKKIRSTRQFIGTKNINEYGIETYKNGSLVYFLIKPINIAVLSESNIANKVRALMILLKEKYEIEILCLSSRESFEDNKAFLEERLAEETEPTIRKLLEKDMIFLDRIQIQTASAREFIFVLRFKNEENKEIYQSITSFSKQLKEQGFVAKRADTDDIKRILAVYYVQNITQVYFEDVNGLSFLLDEES